jgi:hypothetical protein
MPSFASFSKPNPISNGWMWGVTYDDAKEEKKIFGYSWVHKIHNKLGNIFVQPCPSLTLALLLSSCRLRTRSPWPSLWHAASTRGQSVLHDLPLV